MLTCAKLPPSPSPLHLFPAYLGLISLPPNHVFCVSDRRSFLESIDGNSSDPVKRGAESLCPSDVFIYTRLMSQVGAVISELPPLYGEFIYMFFKPDW